MRKRDFTLTNARILDGTGAAPTTGTISVKNGIIQEVTSQTAAPSNDAQVIDVNGATVMPGLIDGHVHLLSNAGEKVENIHLWNVLTFTEEQTLHAAANAVKALQSGVTTVRDLAGSRPEIAVKHVMDAHIFPGARVITAGFVGMTAGHGDMFCPVNIDKRIWTPADGPDECRKLVRQYARDGSDLIKICTSGGVLSVGDKSGWRNFTEEETSVIVDEAHALGMRVAAHAHSRAGIKQALDAGVDTIEHGSSLDAELIQQMVDQGTWLCPTLSISQYMISSGKERGIPEESLEKAEEMRDSRLTSVQQAYQAGVRIFMGTDSCNTMAFGNHAWELQLMIEQLGMTTLEAIRASTSAAAEALNINHLTGTLQRGKAADLLVIDGDPIEDITALQNPQNLLAVMKEGVPYIDHGVFSQPLSTAPRASV